MKCSVVAILIRNTDFFNYVLPPYLIFELANPEKPILNKVGSIAMLNDKER